MQTQVAIKRLLEADKDGLWLYSRNDLGKFLDDDPAALASTIRRLLEGGFLRRAARGLYEFAYPDSSIHRGPDEVALRLRRGYAVYESLESAASKWGIISQIPVGHTMYMTTGRPGLFDTRYGQLEFVHTKLPLAYIMENTVPRGPRRAPLATKELTRKNLISCRRSLDLLLDWEEAGYGED